MPKQISSRIFCLSAVLISLVFILSHCGNDISGPTPAVTQVKVIPAGGGTMNWQGIATGWNGGKTVIRISGENFAPLPEDIASKEKPGLLLPRVWLLADPPIELENILWLDAQNLLATVPAGIDPLPDIYKIYGLKITNPSGGETQIDKAFEVSSLKPPRLGPELSYPYEGVGILPRSANDSENIEVLVLGEDFSDSPSLYLYSGGVTIPADSVTYLYSRAVSATIFAPNLDLGNYDVILVNPDGQYATLAAAFSVVGGTSPAPGPDSAYPKAGHEGSRENLTIYGQDFDSATRVFLGQKPLGYPYPVTAVEAEMIFQDPSRLDLRIPPGLPPGEYDLIIVNSDGQAGVLPGAYTVKTTTRPVIFSVSPAGVCGPQSFSVTVWGASFVPGSRIMLSSGPDIYAPQLTYFDDSETLHADFPWLLNDLYDVIVENPEGEVAILPGAFRITSGPCLVITSVYPPFGYTGEKTQITITGAGFESTPEVILSQGTAAETRLRNVAFISETSLTAVVPAGVSSGGPYSLTVINPSGSLRTLNGLFTVTQNPPPKIDNISPGAATNGTDTIITITGSNFQVAAAPVLTVALLNSSLNPAISCGYFTVNSNTQITANCATSGSSDGQYILKVANQENAYGLYASFVLTNPAGNLNSASAIVSSLNYARMDFGSAVGKDSLGNTFLYAAGGRNGTDYTYSDTIEVAQVDPFGNLGSFQVVPNRMLSPRAGLELVAVPGTQNTFLYAIGGHSNPTTFLNTVERAAILSPEDAPEITNIYSSSGGSLSSGTWYYRVSALKNTSDPDNLGGETLASEEWTIRVDAGSKITLTWNPVANTLRYRIYRTADGNGTSFTELRLGETTGTTFTDDGNIDVGSASPVPTGSCGVWVAAQQLNTSRSGLSSLVASDPGGNRFLYVIGGTSNGNTGLNSYEYAPLNSSGLISSNFTTGGSTLAQARFNQDAVKAGPDNSPELVSGGENYFYLMGGESGGADVGTIDMAQVQTNGTLTAWGTPSCQGPCRSNIPNGMQLILANGYFYTTGGGSTANPTNSIDHVIMTNPNGSLRNWQATSRQLVVNRFMHEAVISGAYFFFLGGWNGTAAVTSVERILW